MSQLSNNTYINAGAVAAFFIDEDMDLITFILPNGKEFYLYRSDDALAYDRFVQEAKDRFSTVLAGSLDNMVTQV